MSKCKSIGRIKDKLEEEGKRSDVGCLYGKRARQVMVVLPPLKETGNTATDAVALELEDQDDDGNSGIAGHPEEV